MANKVQNVTVPISFRPTLAQRQRLERVATIMGNPGRLAVAIRWMIENAPEPAQRNEASNVRGK